MKSYIFPIAYIITDDNYVKLSQIVVLADNDEEAKNLVKEKITRDELTQTDHTEEEEITLPSMWFEDEESDEEGYQIGKPTILLQP